MNKYLLLISIMLSFNILHSQQLVQDYVTIGNFSGVHDSYIFDENNIYDYSGNLVFSTSSTILKFDSNNNGDFSFGIDDSTYIIQFNNYYDTIIAQRGVEISENFLAVGTEINNSLKVTISKWNSQNSSFEFYSTDTFPSAGGLIELYEIGEKVFINLQAASQIYIVNPNQSWTGVLTPILGLAYTVYKDQLIAVQVTGQENKIVFIDSLGVIQREIPCQLFSVLAGMYEYKGQLYLSLLANNQIDSTNFQQGIVRIDSSEVTQIWTFQDYVVSARVYNDTIYHAIAGGTQGNISRIYEQQISSNTNKQKEELLIEIFPNPSKNMINVQGEFQKAIIYNLRGEEVKVFKFNQILDISDIGNGQYFVKFINNDQSITKKIIKIE